MTHNKNLRETIENLRRERGVFDGIYKKLEEELGEKKHDMAAIIDLYNEAYEKRDEVGVSLMYSYFYDIYSHVVEICQIAALHKSVQAFAEMQALKIRADEEQRKFEHEWRQLSTLVQQDRLVCDLYLISLTEAKVFVNILLCFVFSPNHFYPGAS